MNGRFLSDGSGGDKKSIVLNTVKGTHTHCCPRCHSNIRTHAQKMQGVWKSTHSVIQDGKKLTIRGKDEGTLTVSQATQETHRCTHNIIYLLT